MEDEERPTVMFLGRDLAKIPCARNSLINGLAGGAVGGLLTFLFTSKLRLSMHSTVGSYCGTTMVYWFYCRYRYAIAKRDSEKLQKLFQAARSDDSASPPLQTGGDTPVSV